MMSNGESFDAVHVVSDLHLGGPKGQEIFRSEARLAAWIDRVAIDPAEAVALVLAGDIVDFISVYRRGTYFSPSSAARQIDDLFGPDTPTTEYVNKLPKLRDALRAFVATSGRKLVLLIGNHDVELALPQLQERLRGHLCGDDPAARARLLLAMDGQGWRCDVGGRGLYCVHGNEADEFNRNDHEGMRRVAAALERGEDRREGEAVLVRRYWTRNFGTSLVVDLLNEVKSELPLVDLLKPEGEPLFDIVQALKPDVVAAHVGKLLDLLPRGARARTSRSTLGGEREHADALSPDASTPRDRAPELTSHAAGSALNQSTIERLEAQMREGREPEELAAQGSLGLRDQVGIRLRQLVGADVDRPVWSSLQRWKALREYRELRLVDDVIQSYDEHLGPDVEVFIAGHTHAPRALRYGKRIYFNSGTWIELLRVDDLLAPTDSEEVFEAFKRELRSLRSARVGGFAARRDAALIGTAVSVWRESNGASAKVLGALHRVDEPDGARVIGEALQVYDFGPARSAV